MEAPDADVGVLLEQLLDELRALRGEASRQNTLLEAILAKLGEIEQTQYG